MIRKSNIIFKKKYKCTECQSETNDEGNMHCRKIFKEKLDEYLSIKDLIKAEQLIRTTNFRDISLNNWKDEFKKVIEKLKTTKLNEDIQKKEINKIGQKIKSKKILSKDEEKILIKSKKYQWLGYYYYSCYLTTNDIWCLSKSCKYYRSAGMPDTGIKVANKLNLTNFNDEAVAAVFTSMGGAYKDIRSLDKAEWCANEAIKRNRTHYPYSLLGAIYIKKEEFERANQMFNEATKLGANVKNIEREIQREIENASADLSEEAIAKMEMIFYGKQKLQQTDEKVIGISKKIS